MFDFIDKHLFGKYTLICKTPNECSVICEKEYPNKMYFTCEEIRMTAVKSTRRNASSNSYYTNASRKRNHRSGKSRRGRSCSGAGILLLLLLTIIITVITTVTILRLTEKSVHADVTDEMSLCYTSVEIQTGDTLWSIADEADLNGFSDKKEFIRTVERINHINGENIHAGSSLILPYYS